MAPFDVIRLPNANACSVRLAAEWTAPGIRNSPGGRWGRFGRAHVPEVFDALLRGRPYRSPVVANGRAAPHGAPRG